MSASLQEWLAVVIVVLVVAVALRRRWLRRRASACRGCGAARHCDPGKDDDLRVIKPSDHRPRIRTGN